MKTLFYLTGEHVELASQEVLALTGNKDVIHDSVIVSDDGRLLRNGKEGKNDIY